MKKKESEKNFLIPHSDPSNPWKQEGRLETTHALKKPITSRSQRKRGWTGKIKTEGIRRTK